MLKTDGRRTRDDGPGFATCLAIAFSEGGRLHRGKRKDVRTWGRKDVRTKKQKKIKRPSGAIVLVNTVNGRPSIADILRYSGVATATR